MICVGLTFGTYLVALTTPLVLAASAPIAADSPTKAMANSRLVARPALQGGRKIVAVASAEVSLQPRWITVPRIREFTSDAGGLFTDILSRVSSVKWYGDYGTTAHEATHLLNNEISRGIDWAYYVGDGRAALLSPAEFVMSDVARVFPES